MYKPTKEEIEAMRNNPLLGMLSSLCGLDINEVLDEAIKEQENEEKKQEKKKYVAPEVKEEDPLEPYIKCGLIEKFIDTDGKESYRFTNLNSTDKDTTIEAGPDTKHKVNSENTTMSFDSENISDLLDNPEELTKAELPMTLEELTEFIKDYQSLEGSFRKMKYLYGVDFNSECRDESIYAKSNRIIWSLVQKLFGEDNADDICAFIFGDSNFDSVEELYQELT